MPMLETKKHDEYMCYIQPIAIDETYIERVDTTAIPNLHHVVTGVCEEPGQVTIVGVCLGILYFSMASFMVYIARLCAGTKGNHCRGAAVNLGEWHGGSSNHTSFTFPKGVSLKIGSKTRLKYVITEIHYSKPVQGDTTTEIARVRIKLSKTPGKLNYLTFSTTNYGFIPIKKENGYFAEAACPWTSPPVYAYSYFVHTHGHGLLVEGFLIRNGTYILLGSELSREKGRNLVAIPGGPTLIKPGDVLAARCLYVNTGSDPIEFGLSAAKEMCYFQLDLGYDLKYEKDFERPLICETESPKFRFCDYPSTHGLCS